MISENLVRLFEQSMKANWDLPAFTDYLEKKTYTPVFVMRYPNRV